MRPSHSSTRHRSRAAPHRRAVQTRQQQPSASSQLAHITHTTGKAQGAVGTPNPGFSRRLVFQAMGQATRMYQGDAVAPTRTFTRSFSQTTHDFIEPQFGDLGRGKKSTKSKQGPKSHNRFAHEDNQSDNRTNRQQESRGDRGQQRQSRESFKQDHHQRVKPSSNLSWKSMDGIDDNDGDGRFVDSGARTRTSSSSSSPGNQQWKKPPFSHADRDAKPDFLQKKSSPSFRKDKIPSEHFTSSKFGHSAETRGNREKPAWSKATAIRGHNYSPSSHHHPGSRASRQARERAVKKSSSYVGLSDIVSFGGKDISEELIASKRANAAEIQQMITNYVKTNHKSLSRSRALPGKVDTLLNVLKGITIPRITDYDVTLLKESKVYPIAITFGKLGVETFLHTKMTTSIAFKRLYHHFSQARLKTEIRSENYIRGNIERLVKSSSSSIITKQQDVGSIEDNGHATLDDIEIATPENIRRIQTIPITPDNAEDVVGTMLQLRSPLSPLDIVYHPDEVIELARRNAHPLTRYILDVYLRMRQYVASPGMSPLEVPTVPRLEPSQLETLFPPSKRLPSPLQLAALPHFLPYKDKDQGFKTPDPRGLHAFLHLRQKFLDDPRPLHEKIHDYDDEFIQVYQLNDSNSIDLSLQTPSADSLDGRHHGDEEEFKLTASPNANHPMISSSNYRNFSTGIAPYSYDVVVQHHDPYERIMAYLPGILQSINKDPLGSTMGPFPGVKAIVLQPNRESCVGVHSLISSMLMDVNRVRKHTLRKSTNRPEYDYTASRCNGRISKALIEQLRSNPPDILVTTPKALVSILTQYHTTQMKFSPDPGAYKGMRSATRQREKMGTVDDDVMANDAEYNEIMDKLAKIQGTDAKKGKVILGEQTPAKKGVDSVDPQTMENVYDGSDDDASDDDGSDVWFKKALKEEPDHNVVLIGDAEEAYVQAARNDRDLVIAKQTTKQLLTKHRSGAADHRFESNDDGILTDSEAEYDESLDDYYAADRLLNGHNIADSPLYSPAATDNNLYRLFETPVERDYLRQLYSLKQASSPVKPFLMSLQWIVADNADVLTKNDWNYLRSVLLHARHIRRLQGKFPSAEISRVAISTPYVDSNILSLSATALRDAVFVNGCYLKPGDDSDPSSPDTSSPQLTAIRGDSGNLVRNVDLSTYRIKELFHFETNELVQQMASRVETLTGKLGTATPLEDGRNLPAPIDVEIDYHALSDHEWNQRLHRAVTSIHQLQQGTIIPSASLHSHTIIGVPVALRKLAVGIRGGNLLRLFTDGKPVHGGGSIPNVASPAVDPYTLSDPTTVRQVAQRNKANRAYARHKTHERDVVAISEAELIQFIAHKHRIKIEQPRSKEEILKERALRDDRLAIVTKYRKYDYNFFTSRQKIQQQLKAQTITKDKAAAKLAEAEQTYIKNLSTLPSLPKIQHLMELVNKDNEKLNSKMGHLPAYKPRKPLRMVPNYLQKRLLKEHIAQEHKQRGELPPDETEENMDLSMTIPNGVTIINTRRGIVRYAPEFSSLRDLELVSEYVQIQANTIAKAFSAAKPAVMLAVIPPNMPMEALAMLLKLKNFRVAMLYTNQDKHDRNHVQKALQDRKINLIIATDHALRGMNDIRADLILSWGLVSPQQYLTRSTHLSPTATSLHLAVFESSLGFGGDLSYMLTNPNNGRQNSLKTIPFIESDKLKSIQRKSGEVYDGDAQDSGDETEVRRHQPSMPDDDARDNANNFSTVSRESEYTIRKGHKEQMFQLNTMSREVIGEIQSTLGIPLIRSVFDKGQLHPVVESAQKSVRVPLPPEKEYKRQMAYYNPDREIKTFHVDYISPLPIRISRLEKGADFFDELTESFSPKVVEAFEADINRLKEMSREEQDQHFSSSAANSMAFHNADEDSRRLEQEHARLRDQYDTLLADEGLDINALPYKEYEDYESNYISEDSGDDSQYYRRVTDPIQGKHNLDYEHDLLPSLLDDFDVDYDALIKTVMQEDSQQDSSSSSDQFPLDPRIKRVDSVYNMYKEATPAHTQHDHDEQEDAQSQQQSPQQNTPLHKADSTHIDQPQKHHAESAENALSTPSQQQQPLKRTKTHEQLEGVIDDKVMIEVIASLTDSEYETNVRRDVDGFDFVFTCNDASDSSSSSASEDYEALFKGKQ